MALDPHIFGEAVAGFEKQALGYQPKPATHDQYGFAKNLPTMRTDPQTGQQVPIQLPAPRESTLGNLTELSGVPEVGRAVGEIATTAAKHPTDFLGQWLEPPTPAAGTGVGKSPYLNALARTWSGTPGTEKGDDKLVNAGRNAFTVAETAATGAMVPGGLKATGALLRGAMPARAGLGAMGGTMGAAARATSAAKMPGLASTVGRNVGGFLKNWVGKPLYGLGGTRFGQTALGTAGVGTGLATLGGAGIGAAHVAGAFGDGKTPPPAPEGFPYLQTAGMLGLGGLGAYGLYTMLAPRIEAARRKKKRQQHLSS